MLRFPDPRLRQKSLPVQDFDAALGALLETLAAEMVTHRGVGLAAPQTGQFIRAFVAKVDKRSYEFINPVIESSSGRIAFEEGCLSVPGYAGLVRRRRFVRVRFQDRTGASQVLDAQGLLAVVIQHEVDHLNGKLFLDRLPFYRRWFAKRTAAKRVLL